MIIKYFIQHLVSKIRAQRTLSWCILVWILCGSFSLHAKPLILILGDSLSAAYGIAEQKSWVALLEKKLKPDYPQAEVINSSLVGDTTGNGLNRLPKLLDHYHPDIVLIELGGNDGLRGFPLQKIEANLDAMLTLCEQKNAKVLLLGMRLPPNYGSYSEKFYLLYQDLGQKHNVPVVPFLLEGIALKPELMLSDKIHPKEEAQPIILQNIWPKLVDLLSSYKI